MYFFTILLVISFFWGAWMIFKGIAHAVKERNKAPWFNLPCKGKKNRCGEYPMARRHG